MIVRVIGVEMGAVTAGVSYEAARARQMAGTAMRKAVRSKDNPADLINVALEELVRARCEPPATPPWTR
ncbi:hypothetical protein DMH08_32430 [Actinomadura sp. WAC 06369]|nr:hypothetical protein DMH08_32430 [Actinomadura sp. WAC 06369]